MGSSPQGPGGRPKGIPAALASLSKEVLAQIIDFLPDATFAIDTEGKVMAWNRAMEALTGVGPEEILGKGNYEYALPFYGVRRPVLADLALHWDEGAARTYEYVRRDGDLLISETRNPPFRQGESLFWNAARPLYDRQGHIIGAVEVIRDITALMEAEKAMRQSEATYRALFEHSGTACLIIEEDTIISKANHQFEILSGYNKEDIEGKLSWTQFVVPEDLERMKRYHYERRKDPAGAPQEYEFRFVDRQGQVKHVLNRVTVIPGTKRSIASLLDVTFSRQAEETLRQNEEKYRSLFENTGAATFLVEEDMTISEINQRAEVLTGYSREEVVGKMTTMDLTAPEERTLLKKYHIDRRKDPSSAPSEYEFTMVVKGGKRKQVFIQTAVIPGTKRSIASIIDITDKKKAEDALRISEERYRQTFEHVNDVIFSYDRDLRITSVTPSAQRLVGYTPEDLIGRRIDEVGILLPEDLEKAMEDAARVLAGESIAYREYSFVTRDGRKGMAEVSGHPIFEGDSVVGAVSVARDITEKVKAEKEKELLEAQLLQAQKMEAVGTLAGGVAHDFNNLLQAILGYTQIMMMGRDKDDPDMENLLQVEQAAKRAGELVQQLLAFSRKVKSKLRPVNLNREVEQVAKLLKRTLPKMIQVDLKLEENLRLIRADAAQLEQVIMNICINARDAMPEGGRLIIETANVHLDEPYCREHLGARAGDHVLLSISDNGVGMDKETLQHIFEPFFTTKDRGQGTGLGLAMVYGIVKNHGGYIMCYSEPGKGTTFKIYFPRVDEEEGPARSTLSREMPLLKGHGELILLADDEEQVRNLGKEILERFGYRVLLAPDGQSALKIFRKRQKDVDLVILDYVMPGMSGKECLEEIVKLDPEAKVIVASGYSVNGPTGQALEKGAKAVVSKPYEVKQFLKVVKEVLDTGH